jgi:hypothetical protein
VDPLLVKKPAALPATPNTSTNMDSDDDFNSVHSSEDFQDQDSEVSEQAGIYAIQDPTV